MERVIRKYDLHDSQQYEDERHYWLSKTPEEKLQILEAIRKTGSKLLNKNREPVNGDQQRLRRVLRVVEQT
jgi:predicted Fe-S protein YdhL (DUF1289 family)